MRAIILFTLACCLVAVWAQTCNNLNAQYEVRVDPFYQQYLSDFAIADSSNIVLTQNFEQKDNDMKTTILGSHIGVLNLETREFNALLQQARIDVHNKFGGQTLLGSNQTRIFTMSNVEKVYFAPTPAEKAIKLQLGDGLTEQLRTIVVLTVPTEENPAFSKVYFLALNATAPDAPSIDAGDVIAYEYPFQADEEAIYDVHGQVVGHQTIDFTSSAIDTDAFHGEAQVRLLRSASSNDILGSISFVALSLNQQSLKLVKYQATINPFNHNIKFQGKTAKLVMPKVEGTGNATVLGGSLHTTQDDIFAVVHVSREQVAAFNTLHQVTITLEAGQEVVPVLLKFDKETLALQFAVNLASGLTGVSTLYAAGLDAREGVVFVGSNTHRRSMHIARQPTDDQRAYVTRVKFNATVVTETLAAGLSAAVVTDEDKKLFGANVRFVLNDVSCSLSADESDKVIVGGTIGDWMAPYNVDARASLVQLVGHGANAKALYNMDAGEQGSNAVDFIRRKKVADSEIMFLGMMVDAPQTPPPANPADDKSRSVKTGFWQIDCTPLDRNLQNIMSASFFAFFGVVMVVFVGVVGFYGTVAVYHFITSRRASQFQQIH